jgi:hypothetical protein
LRALNRIKKASRSGRFDSNKFAYRVRTRLIDA